MQLHGFTHDWGIVKKCPYCTRTDIKRETYNQVTCGGTTCRLQHNNRAQQKHRKARKRAKAKAE